MKKKIAMLLCATLFCASALTGCSNLDNAGTTASSRSAADSVVATESAAESETAADTADYSETAAESEAADTEASSENVTATADISDTTVAGWQFVVEKLEKNKSLENVSVDLGYTGVETNDYVKEASDGNVYYLIKMQINKDGSTEAIDWASLKLTDSDGNEYTRIDDEFLTNLGMTRNKGWIAFEIKEDASGLTLSYPFESETYSCELPDLQ